MNEKLLEQIKENMKLNSTEELLKIWEKINKARTKKPLREQCSEESFEAIRRLLTEREAFPKRPTSVTVIAWIIIVAGGLSFVSILAYTISEVQWALEAADISVAIDILWRIVSGVIGVVSGIAILKGLNWGRLLYLCFVPISIVIGWILYGFRPTDILTVIIYIVVLVFLTSPAASAFFASGVSE